MTNRNDLLIGIHMLSLFCAGSQLELDEETVQGVLAACRQEIG